MQSPLPMNRFQNLDVDQALRLIVEGTASETGTGFYNALVKGLAATLNTNGAWVTEFVEEANRLRALAFWLNGEFVSDYEYDLPGTPCEPVIREAKLVHIPDNVAQLFPNDPDLKAFGAVSYLGVPLRDGNNEILGHLAILDSNPLPADPRLLNFFRIFAVRTAAEHRRLHTEQVSGGLNSYSVALCARLASQASFPFGMYRWLFRWVFSTRCSSGTGVLPL